MDELHDEVQEFQERWNSMVLDITEDGVITCDEAHSVHQWIAGEREAYALLKERVEQIESPAALLHAVDELSQKADAMDTRMERIIAQCQERDGT